MGMSGRIAFDERVILPKNNEAKIIGHILSLADLFMF